VWVRPTITCAIASALIAHSAAADRIGVVAIAREAGARTAVRIATARALGDDPAAPVIVDDVLALARDDIARGAVPRASLAAFRHVRELADEGWRAYLRVEFELAQSRLAVARTEAEPLVALTGGPELYADVSLRLGIVLGALGHADDAQAALALALALDRDRPITLVEFSPDVVAAVDAVRALAPARHRISIATEPPGSAIALDGTPVATIPVALDVAHGQHVVVARARGFVAHARAFAVGDADASLDIALDRDDERARIDTGAIIGLPDGQAQALIDTASELADVDEVVLVAATDRRGGEALLVQRCAGTPARCTAVVELGYGARDGMREAARGAWHAVRNADLHYPPSVLGDPRLAEEVIAAHRCELCRSPWLWGGVSAAAIAAAIAVVAVVTASKPPPIVGVDPGQFFK
jgi:hypothetical protein